MKLKLPKPLNNIKQHNLHPSTTWGSYSNLNNIKKNI